MSSVARRRFRLTRFSSAALIALLLAVPTWIGPAWKAGDAAAVFLTVSNLPGVYVMWRSPCMPPDGYPGLCPWRALVALTTQLAVWYALLSFPGLIGLGRKRAEGPRAPAR